MSWDNSIMSLSALTEAQDHPAMTNPIDVGVQHAIATISDPSALIDTIATVRGYFLPDNPETLSTLSAYLSSTLSLQDTVSHFADPIDEAYSTADHGQAWWRAEQSNRVQRQAWTENPKSPKSAEEIRELWGDPVALTEPDPNRKGRGSVESQLWELWFGVVHSARKLHWQDEAAQNQLIDLVAAFKARPDPPKPEETAVSLKSDWVYASGKLWSTLALLGPSARECWNDSPGVGAGLEEVEIKAWENANALVSRLSVKGVADFWLYGVWALRDAAEGRRKERPRDLADRGIKGEVEVRTAAVWMRVVGQEIWAKAGEIDGCEAVEANTPADKLPWHRSNQISRARWKFCRSRFEAIAGCEQRATTRAKAAEIVALMADIEGQQQDVEEHNQTRSTKLS